MFAWNRAEFDRPPPPSRVSVNLKRSMFLRGMSVVTLMLESIGGAGDVDVPHKVKASPERLPDV